ncbi:MAG: cupin domain-containing protein [Desulfobacterales bacterium]|nr:cupin domain-containing protein [Desulfobacterales bacterium]
MKKIVLGICLILFLFNSVWSEDTATVKVETLAKSKSSWDGNTLPKYGKGQPEITILRITIPPGDQLPLHHHPVINAGVLLTGELTVITEDNKTLHLKAGDSIVEVVNTWHYGKNEGKDPAEIIVFYAGISGDPITIKK